MEYLGDKLNFKSMEDWYKISIHDFRNNEGNGLLVFYGNSPSKCVMEVFPKKKWLPWLFTNQINNNNDKYYVSWLKKLIKTWELELHITHPQNWYNISKYQLEHLPHGKKLLKNNKSLYNALKLAVPKYNWNELEFNLDPFRCVPCGLSICFQEHY